MTEQKHIQHPARAASFCGKDGPGFAPLEALEDAQPGEVCPVCLAQIMEHGRNREGGPHVYGVPPKNWTE